MRFKKIFISKPNPWEFPSRYPYINLEGPARQLSNKENKRIMRDRRMWHPSETATELYQTVKRNFGKTLVLRIENSKNYYDSVEDLPKEFIAELKDAFIEKIKDVDMEFEQFFILLSNPRYLNGDSIFKEYNFDYNTLIKEDKLGDYRLNFSSIVKLSVKQNSIWSRFF